MRGWSRVAALVRSQLPAPGFGAVVAPAGYKAARQVGWVPSILREIRTQALRNSPQAARSTAHRSQVVFTIRQTIQQASRRWASVATAAASHQPSLARAVGGAALSEGLTPGSRRALAWWLGGCSAWVAVLIVLGGITRLTRSGLSMTSWKFTGERVPRGDEEWQEEFEKYRRSPEWARVNSRMTLEEFKWIYFMEYAHRTWGRALGAVFALPALGFALAGKVNRALGKRLLLLLTMGATQGLVGWWMVRSGLDEPENPYAVPRVSPYRLASHLVSAFAIYATLLWTTLDLAVPRPVTVDAGAGAARRLLRGALPLAALIAVTAASGAFVAGLDAGRAYNTFPTMNGDWVPEEYWETPGWRKAFENTAAAQLHHRVLALCTLAGVVALFVKQRRMPELPRSAKRWATGLLHSTAFQVVLGITALLTYVPVELGSAHQANAIAVFSTALALLHALRPPSITSPIVRALAPFATPAAALTVVGIGAAVAQAETHPRYA